MARGGGRRTYIRDANGRFASTPGGGSKSLAAARKAARPTSGRRGTLQARTSLKKSRAKLAGKDPADQRLSTALSTRAQKGAVTRGSKALKTAKADSRARISGGRKGVVNKPKGLKAGTLSAAKGAPQEKAIDKTSRGSGIQAIPRADLKRYRMLQNKIKPLRDLLSSDGSRMMDSTTSIKRASEARERYSLNLGKLNRITDTLRRLSNSPDSPNIPRLPFVAAIGPRVGRFASIKRMDGPRKFGGQSWRDLRGRYSAGQIEYEDNYMNKLYKRKNKGETIKGKKISGVIRKSKPKPKSIKSIDALGNALKSGNLPLQTRTRKEATMAYRSKTNRLGKFVDGRKELGDNSGRVVAARSAIMQGTIFGGVKRVGAGPMKPIGYRSVTGAVRRKASKPRPILGSKKWRKEAERNATIGQADPWKQAAYNRLYGKSK